MEESRKCQLHGWPTEIRHPCSATYWLRNGIAPKDKRHLSLFSLLTLDRRYKRTGTFLVHKSWRLQIERHIQRLQRLGVFWLVWGHAWRFGAFKECDSNANHYYFLSVACQLCTVFSLQVITSFYPFKKLFRLVRAGNTLGSPRSPWLPFNNFTSDRCKQVHS